MTSRIMPARGERGISRVLQKLETTLENKQYYEAHQMYRTLYFRYLGHKKYEELLTLLFKGSTLLLSNDQQTSGADLAILIIDVLTTSGTPPCEEWIEKIAQLFQMIHDSVPEREAFLTKSVKWSMGETSRGHPLLHKKIAQIYWSEKKYALAYNHFLHSADGVMFANLLIELQTTEGLAHEVDLFIAQAVFRLLCLKNVETAKQTYRSYITLHPELKCEHTEPPYPLPLLNFLWALLDVIEQKNADAFQKLRSVYDQHLMRDPNYTIYLDNVAKKYYGIKIVKENKTTSLLDGLFKSLVIESNTENENVTRQQNAPAPDLD